MLVPTSYTLSQGKPPRSACSILVHEAVDPLNVRAQFGEDGVGLSGNYLATLSSAASDLLQTFAAAVA